MRLLIVKTSSMGDVVHALPAVTDLHRHVPGLEIDWLVEPPFAALPALHPGVSQVHRLAWRKWRKQLWKPEVWRQMGALREALKARCYDAVLDLQGLLKSALWARQANAPVWGFAADSAREPMASRFYARTATVSRTQQAVWRNRALAAEHLGYAKRLNLDHAPADFGLKAPELAPDRLPDLPPGAAYAVLVPNASRPEKLWPEPAWIAVGHELQRRNLQPVVLWGSPAEEAMAQRIAQGCDGVVPPFLTVAEAAGLLWRAQAVVGLDTGFSHLAAALGRPVVGIYCDHEPGLAGLTGPGPLRCLGGKGQRPSQAEVLAALATVLDEAAMLPASAAPLAFSTPEPA